MEVCVLARVGILRHGCELRAYAINRVHRAVGPCACASRVLAFSVWSSVWNIILVPNEWGRFCVDTSARGAKRFT
jgi:hypothetical protein